MGRLPSSLVISSGQGQLFDGGDVRRRLRVHARELDQRVAGRSVGIEFAGTLEAVAFLLGLVRQRRQPDPGQLVGRIKLQRVPQQFASRLGAACLVGDDGPSGQVGR